MDRVGLSVVDILIVIIVVAFLLVLSAQEFPRLEQRSASATPAPRGEMAPAPGH